MHEGTGMGLSTVQGMMEQLQGMITIESHVGQGTTFHLYFPEIGATAEDDTPLTQPDLPRGTERILLVDDDEMVATMTQAMLTEMGYQVTLMTDSQETLKLFAANAESFQLVITDQTMPSLTGKELILELKQIRPDIPTIICTGYSSKIDEDKAKELGINAFLMKPLALPELLQTVRRVLDREKN
jgi:CheY-like chemotaxis protein